MTVLEKPYMTHLGDVKTAIDQNQNNSKTSNK